MLNSKTDEEKWEELLDMDVTELLDYLYELGDEAFCSSYGAEDAIDVLKYIVRVHHEELEGYFESFLETHGSGDFGPMNPEETMEDFMEHEDLEGSDESDH